MGQSTSPEQRKRQHRIGGGSEEAAQEITHLLALDVPALRLKWAAVFGASPSPYLGRVLMVRAIAHRVQERVFGGLKPSTQKILDRVCDTRGEIAPQHIPRPRASAGTVLIREWRGVRHRVTVLDNDVVYRGRRYKSLSEVARAITGTRWSGPLFFGLKGRAKEVARG
ncbi:MAG: DUF2924 domain-containing protein [Candidatus Binatus sp.]|uniref:DUF2924 domain-containing protein n=1 Tax=Candidatus Binatus sp. TaxID=2811406 RepID=UPI003C77C624